MEAEPAEQFFDGESGTSEPNIYYRSSEQTHNEVAGEVAGGLSSAGGGNKWL